MQMYANNQIYHFKSLSKKFFKAYQLLENKILISIISTKIFCESKIKSKFVFSSCIYTLLIIH